MSKFSCKEITFDGANNPVRCKCKPAVMRTYERIKEGGSPEQVALEAAYRVYRHHHPLDTKQDSRLTVERWIFAERLH